MIRTLSPTNGLIVDYQTDEIDPRCLCNVVTALVLLLGVEGETAPDGELAVVYSWTPVTIGGVGPYTYAITAGALPDGLTLDADTGEVSGTPSVDDIFAFTITVTDSLGETATLATTITINP